MLYFLIRDKYITMWKLQKNVSLLLCHKGLFAILECFLKTWYVKIFCGKYQNIGLDRFPNLV